MASDNRHRPFHVIRLLGQLVLHSTHGFMVFRECYGRPCLPYDVETLPTFYGRLAAQGSKFPAKNPEASEVVPE